MCDHQSNFVNFTSEGLPMMQAQRFLMTKEPKRRIKKRRNRQKQRNRRSPKRKRRNVAVRRAVIVMAVGNTKFGWKKQQLRAPANLVVQNQKMAKTVKLDRSFDKHPALHIKISGMLCYLVKVLLW